MEFKHVSVLLDECIDNLNIKETGAYLDGTLGGGGHSEAIANHLSQDGLLIGIDQDQAALDKASQRLAKFEDKVKLYHANYADIKTVLFRAGVKAVDGILLDLGVSSYQLDKAQRGFSYMQEAPLDMRMNPTTGKTAKEIVNTYQHGQLAKVFRLYGEEKFAGKIASDILKQRAIKPIETTLDLVHIIDHAIPEKVKRKRGHSSKKVFQALRIEVNRELEVLETSLQLMIDLLNPGGRLCIITFHSLEDRIVKRMFRDNENPCTCPPDFPVCACGKVPTGTVISRKPILPSKEEQAKNMRSLSAKLRVFEKARAGDGHE